MVELRNVDMTGFLVWSDFRERGGQFEKIAVSKIQLSAGLVNLLSSTPAPAWPVTKTQNKPI